jgi:tRNA(Ile)-lysidine synthase
MADNAREDAGYLDETAFGLYGSCLVKKEKAFVGLDAARLSDMKAAMAGRIARYAIRDVKGDVKGIESIHISDILALCKGRTGSELHLPGNLRARLSYGVLEIFLAADCESIDYELALQIPGNTLAPETGYSVETGILAPKNIEQYRNMGYNSLEQIFDYDRLKMGIYLRNRRNGDIFKPYGGKGTKKLKEYFIDEKIPRHERKQLPLIAKNNEIVWIVGHKISDKFKVTENTNTVLYMKLSRL